MGGMGAAVTPSYLRSPNDWSDTVFLMQVAAAGAMIVLGVLYAAWGN